MATSDKSGKYAVVGLGVTRQGKLPDYTTRQVADWCIRDALADAGLKRKDIDGYLFQAIDPRPNQDLKYLGMQPKFAYHMSTGGATAGAMMMTAVGLLEIGLANYVLVTGAHRLWSEQVKLGSGGYGIARAWGYVSPIANHAMNARRHMWKYGTTEDHLGEVAVTQRGYANRRPEAIMHDVPMTMEDHHNSPWICEPFRLLDCTRDTDGGVAIIVTTAERARDLKAKAVPILGWGAGHNMRRWADKTQFDGLDTARARETAYGIAGIGPDDVDVFECYDAFTINVLLQLEGYGFCGEGEGGPFVAAGGTKLHGRIPTNTAGGQLSGWYIMGMTPITEGIKQMRGEAGETQVKDAKIGLVTGHGGGFGVQNSWAHSCLVLGSAS